MSSTLSGFLQSIEFCRRCYTEGSPQVDTVGAWLACLILSFHPTVTNESENWLRRWFAIRFVQQLPYRTRHSDSRWLLPTYFLVPVIIRQAITWQYREKCCLSYWSCKFCEQTYEHDHRTEFWWHFWKQQNLLCLTAIVWETCLKVCFACISMSVKLMRVNDHNDYWVFQQRNAEQAWTSPYRVSSPTKGIGIQPLSVDARNLNSRRCGPLVYPQRHLQRHISRKVRKLAQIILIHFSILNIKYDIILSRLLKIL